VCCLPPSQRPHVTLLHVTHVCYYKFVETRAKIGDTISNERGQWLKNSICSDVYLVRRTYAFILPDKVLSKQFKWGRDSVEDDPRSGFPSDVITDEMCRAVKAFVLADRRGKVSRTGDEMSTSEGSVIRILHDKLGMSKVT